MEQPVTPAEFPKMLYRGGNAYDGATGRGVPPADTRLVSNAEEEAEARSEGFAPAGEDPHRAPAPEPVTEEAPPVVEDVAANPEESEPVNPVDTDGDGRHDDTGQFVSPQPPRARKPKAKVRK